MCVHIDENDMDKRRVNHKLARKLVKQILVMDIIFKHILVEEKTFLFVTNIEQPILVLTHTPTSTLRLFEQILIPLESFGLSLYFYSSFHSFALMATHKRCFPCLVILLLCSCLFIHISEFDPLKMMQRNFLFNIIFFSIRSKCISKCLKRRWMCWKKLYSLLSNEWSMFYSLLLHWGILLKKK